MKTDKLISMMMPAELITAVKELAVTNSLSMSAQIRLILLEYINTHSRK